MRLWHTLIGLLLAAAQAHAAPQGRARPPRVRKPHPAADPSGLTPDRAHELWYWIEDHLEIVFPVVGVTVILLVLWALRRGWAAQADEIAVRTRQKESIVRLMRLRLTVTPEMVAHELQIDPFHAASLLDELTREGVLALGRATGGVTSYRLKGL
jgi:hypothetical protein